MDERKFADRYLFGPLGIDDYQWDTAAEGNLIGGWGLYLTPRDMARLGQLFLQEGEWQGQQIVSADWVRKATAKHVEAGGDLDYGYSGGSMPIWASILPLDIRPVHICPSGLTWSWSPPPPRMMKSQIRDKIKEVILPAVVD
jgi:CubicO group peptidase (beta-lactamase class C family)